MRTIWKEPGFSAVIILTLALGIGVNAAIFSIVYAVLLAPPPYPAGERLVDVWETTSGQNIPVSWIDFQHWRGENHTFEEVAGVETADLTLSGRGDAVLTHAGVVSAGFFRLTGWRPLAGRLFSDADDRPGAAPVVVLSREFCDSVLGAGAYAIGSALDLDGKAYEIIGVLPAGVRFFAEPIDIYLPAGPRDGAAVNRAEHDRMVLLGLLKPGITLGAARTDLDAIMVRLARADPGPESDHRASIAWLADFGRSEVRRTLLMLMSAAGLVLAIACANVAGLLLARGTSRTREMAVRTALGARRSRLARELLTGNAVMASFGGGLGLVLAAVCLRVLAVVGPRDIPQLSEAGLKLPVLAFTASISLITALLAGLAPVFQARGVDLMAALKEGSFASGAGKRGQYSRSGLAIAEIAVTVMLSFACILLLRSFMLAQAVYPGFDAAGVLALDVQLPPSRYANADAVRRFYGRLIDRIRREPGVESAGSVNCPPSTGGCARGWYSMAEMAAPARADVPLTLLTTVSPGYFKTMRMRLLAGRSFTEADREGSPEVVVINEKIARRWWPAAPQMAVGHRIKFGGPWMAGLSPEIVGVVADVNQAGLGDAPVAETYAPFAQRPSAAMVVMIRGAGEPAHLIPGARRALAEVDREVAVQSLRPFGQWMSATLGRRRFSTVLLAIFAILALTLSAVGVYGVLGQWIGMREREIAIRIALGARRRQILGWSGRHAARLVALGVALGMAGGWVASRWLGSLVFGISSGDARAMIAAAGVAIAVSGIAVGGPMWRSTRVEAVRHLRDG